VEDDTPIDSVKQATAGVRAVRFLAALACRGTIGTAALQTPLSVLYSPTAKEDVWVEYWHWVTAGSVTSCFL
jgi:hypothetical protein